MQGNLLTIEGKAVEKLLKYEISYAKSWGDDTGRDMAGTMMGSFKGIYPYLQLEIGSCNKEELSSLLRLLNKPSFNVRYYDIESEGFYSAKYSAEDITVSLKKQYQMRFNAYQINLTPITRRESE